MLVESGLSVFLRRREEKDAKAKLVLGTKTQRELRLQFSFLDGKNTAVHGACSVTVPD